MKKKKIVVRVPRKLRRMLLDGWSLPHFMFGVVVALATLVFSLPRGEMFLGIFLIAVGWEFIELRFRIHETRFNRAIDILLPLIAYVVTLKIVEGGVANHDHHVALFVVAFLVYAYLTALAWEARFHHERGFLS